MRKLCNLIGQFSISRSPARRSSRFSRRLNLEHLEARYTPAGNIHVTNGMLVTPQGQPLSAPVNIGEEVFLEIFWTTTDLPADANYKIDYELNGIHISLTFTFGAGLAGTQSWAWYFGGWYALSGQNSGTISINEDQTTVESTYADNGANLFFTPNAAPDLPQKFQNPFPGNQTVNWFIGGYVDVDPRGGIFRDFAGGLYGYDGHKGHDMGGANFDSMDTGLPVYAAADGVVVAVHDGAFDRNTVFNPMPTNYVEIDHGNGWHTFYYHLRTNTILVHVGEQVVAGQTLGLEGSSGNSTAAHLHFEVQHKGIVVETELAPDVYWADPQIYTGSRSAISDAGITNNLETVSAALGAGERPATANGFSQSGGQLITNWFQVNTVAGHQVEGKFRSPSGADLTTLDFSFIATGTGLGWYYVSRILPANMESGVWHIENYINGQLLANNPFIISADGAPAAQVEQNSKYLPNGRTTPLDFGATDSGSIPPEMIFTINNPGVAELHVGNLALPQGFSLVGTFPRVISAGSSAFFIVDMSTAHPGTLAGELRFSTNDPNAPVYSFNIKGVVNGGLPGAVHGLLFYDADGNGIENDNETGPVGATVQLLDGSNNAVVATTSTGFNGYYAFPNPSSGSYRIRPIVPAGMSFTTPVSDVFSVNKADISISPIGLKGTSSTHLTLIGLSNPTAGVSTTLTIKAVKADGQVDTSYLSTVRVLSSEPGTWLPADYTFTAADQGVKTFSVIYMNTGSQQLTVADAFGGASPALPVVVGYEAASIHLSGIPSTPTAGMAYGTTVTALDEFGGVATGFSGAIHFSSSDPKAILPSDYTFGSNDLGSKTFPSIVVRTAGLQSITVTVSSISGISGSEQFIVLPAAGTQLRFAQQPVSTPSGQPMSVVTVQIFDSFGNLATSTAGQVILSLADNPRQAKISGGIGSELIGGTAAFSNLIVNGGGFGLSLIVSGSGVGTATSTQFNSVLLSNVLPVAVAAEIYGPRPNLSQAESYIKGVYRTLLGRDADDPGLIFWLGQLGVGSSRAGIIDAFWNSSENRGREVDAYYQAYLGRTADIPGHSYWVERLKGGADETEIVFSFLLSQEALQAPNDVFVQRLYQGALGRSASLSDVDYWTRQLAGGATRTNVATSFVFSAESAGVAVDSFFEAYLQRLVDSTGRTYWVDQLRQQKQTFTSVAKGILGSEEFFANAKLFAL